MDITSLTALLVAVVGVAGTLASALLTQRRSDALRREERELTDRLRREEAAEQRRTVDLAERRAGYTAYNIAARQFLSALNDAMHALRRDPATAGPELATMEALRVEYRNCYAEAQMAVPDRVLAEVTRANRSLSTVYGILKRLAHGSAGQAGPVGPTDRDESLATAVGAIETCWTHLARLRVTMRRDLGISAAPPPAAPDAP
ncbi:hypothetical protein ACFCX4_20265 [Kitasatospora sp. NPDC056327]|uniref:hypothetical protein n=1 Tax=Kitasatospora sp. NPDC056327 TaxID=3345785 RepID=UPI0035D6816C